MKNADLDKVTTVRKGSMIEFYIPKMITEQEACELQADLSYHPAGYGFYAFKSCATETTWKCGASCD